MAKMTTSKKKKTVRAVRKSGIALTPTDSWLWAKWYIHYEVDSKGWGDEIKAHIKAHYDKQTVATINKLTDWRISNHSHWATTAYLLRTKPDLVPKEYKTGIVKFVEGLIEQGKAVVQEKKIETKKVSVPAPSIQERITEQSKDACDAIEEWLDGFITDKKGFNPKGLDFTAHFATKKVSQAHARKIQKFYKSELEEARLIVNNMPTPQAISKIKDPVKQDLASQFREGYNHIAKKDAKAYLDALETVDGACMMVIESAKATRKPRIKKAPTADKLIAKLKYKDKDDKYQLTSVNPLELVNATEIWIFNIKTRKLGKYIADEYAMTMTVKGTTIVGFDELKSVQKTLRKTEDQLKEFKAAGKIKLRKFMEDIKTTDTKLNGRINADTIILKVMH
jgi:hypothetical protein